MATSSLVRHGVVRGLVCACAFLAGCALLVKKAVKRPTVSFVRMVVLHVTFSEGSVNVVFDVDNPNVFAIPVRSFDYALKVGEHTLASGDQTTSFEAPAQGRATLVVPVRVRYGDATNAVRLLGDAEMWPYSVSGKVKIDSGPLAGITVPFSHRDSIPRPMPPSVRIERLNVRSLGLASIDLDVVLSLHNSGKIVYTLASFAGSVELNGERFFSIDRLPGPVRLPPQADQTLTIPVRLSGLSLVRGLQSILSQGQAECHLVGEVGVQTDRFGTLPLALDERGDVRLYR